MVAARDVSRLRAWAEKHVVVADGPRAGKRFKPGNAAWGEVLDSMDDPAVQQLVVRGSVQSGKTASLIVASLGFSARGESVLLYQPDDKLKIAMSTRLRAWARACTDPVVSEAWERPRPPHQRAYSNGGRLEVLNAGARTAALMRTASVIVVDELRAFGRDMLGELVDRMASYGSKGKLITVSSAGEEGVCKTTTELEKSDARHLFIGCPACGRKAPAEWRNVIFPKNPKREPTYTFPCCTATVTTSEFKRAVNLGEWRPTRDAAVPGIRGYHADCFVSPFETLGTIVRVFKRARHHQKQTTSHAELRAFQMSRLALPYRPPPAQGVTAQALALTCRESYENVPVGASMLIGACDTQDNRLEVEVSAWGLVEVERAESEVTGAKGWESTAGYHGLRHGDRWYRLRRWAIEYRRIVGDPGQPQVWDELVRFMETPRMHESGVYLRPCLVLIDSGGHYSAEVAEFARSHGQTYMAIKGVARKPDAPLMRRSITQDSLHDYGPLGLGLIGVDAAKSTLFSWMRQSTTGVEPRPMTWPADESRYGPVEFDGLVSGVSCRGSGQAHGEDQEGNWRKTAKYNEPLDLAVYSLAAAHYLGLAFMLAEQEQIHAYAKAA